MNIASTDLPGVLLIEPLVHVDFRGHFLESFNERTFQQKTGLSIRFVQDNHSYSKRHVLRGLHYQLGQPQGKLVRVVSGSVFDVAVDLRRSSSTFGQWIGHDLSAENRRQLWIPIGFAHGFLVTSDHAELIYKTTDYYAAGEDRCLAWDDESVGVRWPIEATPVLSERDAAAPRFCSADVFS